MPFKKKAYILYYAVFNSIDSNKSIPHDGEGHRTIKKTIVECVKIEHPDILIAGLTLVDMWLRNQFPNV